MKTACRKELTLEKITMALRYQRHVAPGTDRQPPAKFAQLLANGNGDETPELLPTRADTSKTTRYFFGMISEVLKLRSSHQTLQK